MGTNPLKCSSAKHCGGGRMNTMHSKGVLVWFTIHLDAFNLFLGLRLISFLSCPSLFVIDFILGCAFFYIFVPCCSDLISYSAAPRDIFTAIVAYFIFLPRYSCFCISYLILNIKLSSSTDWIVVLVLSVFSPPSAHTSVGQMLNVVQGLCL